MDDQTLKTLAEDAFVVLNWAKRQGMKKEEQLKQVIMAFKKTLMERQENGN